VYDAVSLTIYLSQLKYSFDKKMHEAQCFEEVRHLYFEIKKVETQLCNARNNAMQA
jgi:hypothetical protein